MASSQPVASRRFAAWLPAGGCALAGWVVFQFWGNATLGYIHTRSVFWWWGWQWFNPASDSEHGILVLGLAVWLLWRNLTIGDWRMPMDDGDNRYSKIGIWPSLAAMLGGLALHLLGYVVQQTRISVLALLLFTWGVLALGGGRRWRRAAAFPLAFMVFALPLNILDTLGFYLRMGVVDVAYVAVRLVGIDVVRNGTQLFSPHGGYQYDVAAACSGVRSLMALAALSLLIGYLNFRAWWKRGLLLVLCVPYAFIGNVARILVIIFAAEWFGQKAGAVVHEWFGFIVFVIVLALQFATVAVLRRGKKEGMRGSESEGEREKEKGREGAGEREGESEKEKGVRGKGWMVAAVVIAAAAGVIVTAHRLDAEQTAPATGIYLTADGRNPVPLPAHLGFDWIGRGVPVSEVERTILPPDTGFSRKTYVSVENPTQQVFVSIVLSGRDRTSIHRPELCLVGQGWTIKRSFRHRFDSPKAGRATVPATVLRVEHEAVAPDGKRVRVPALVAYWFVSRDRVVATHWERMAWGALDRLRHLRSHRWAYVLVQTGAADGEGAALARLQDVLNRTLPVFQRPETCRAARTAAPKPSREEPVGSAR